MRHESTRMRHETTGAARNTSLRPANRAAAEKWSSGGRAYDRVSRQIADAIEHAVDRLAPRSGQHVLDVATGTGWTARRVAARGARVTGIDFGEDVIRAAQELGPDDRLEFLVGDAEDLPFPDGHFDGVISTFGVMFCRDPRRAAAELARVCKPGGRLSLANWAVAGTAREMFELIRSHQPTPPDAAPSPFAWGDETKLREWLDDMFDLDFECALSTFNAPDAITVWNEFAAGFGPIVTLERQLDAAARARLRQDFVEFHERFRSGTGVLVERPYVVLTGQRLD